MKRKHIDLSDIKDDEMDKTGSFTDLMTRSERKRHKEIDNQEIFNVEESVSETKENKDIKKNLLTKATNRKKDKMDVEDIIKEKIDKIEVESGSSKSSKSLVFTFLLSVASLSWFICCLLLDLYTIRKTIVAGFITLLLIIIMTIIFNSKKTKGWLVIYYIMFLGYLFYNIIIITGYYQNLLHLLQ